MDKHYHNLRQQAGLVSSICGMLIGLPAIAMPGVEAQKLSQTNPNPTIFREAPYNGGGSNSPLNPSPNIFNEPPYNRSRSTSPTQPSTSPTMAPMPGAVITPPMPGEQPVPGTQPMTPPRPSSGIQPPLPEEQGTPSAMVTPMNGMVNIRLVNQTGADINYQVIGDTNQRSLRGRSNVMLQNLKTPVTLTFKRQDGGLLKVTPQASSEAGMLAVTFTETADLGTDKSTMRIQATGAVFLN